MQEYIELKDAISDYNFSINHQPELVVIPEFLNRTYTKWGRNKETGKVEVNTYTQKESCYK